MKNFYDIFQHERAKMQKLGLEIVHLAVPDKAPEHLKFAEVQKSANKLDKEGHKVTVQRMDSNSEHGFFGNFFMISCNPSDVLFKSIGQADES